MLILCSNCLVQQSLNICTTKLGFLVTFMGKMGSHRRKLGGGQNEEGMGVQRKLQLIGS